MGRDCGYIALITGITGGAEAIVIPEVITDPEAVAREFRTAYERGKAHAIVVVAEGARYNAEGLADYFQKHRERLGFELRVTKLGHVQRGRRTRRIRSFACHPIRCCCHRTNFARPSGCADWVS